MKRILAFILTVSMLLGVIGIMGTAAIAEEAPAAPDLPQLIASVKSDGTVTAKLSNGDTDFNDVYARVWDKNGNSSYYVSLTYDSSKGAFVGKNTSVAKGKISYVTFSDDKYDGDDYSRKYFDYNFNKDGTPSYNNIYTRSYTNKQFDYEYTDSEGNKVTASTTVQTNYKNDQYYQHYESNGALYSVSHSVTGYDGSVKERTTVATTDHWYYDPESGILTSTLTASLTASSVGYATKGGSWTFSITGSSRTEEIR